MSGEFTLRPPELGNITKHDLLTTIDVKEV